MKETVEHLREGWHGNDHLFRPEDGKENSYIPGNVRRRYKKAVDCRKLVAKAIDFGTTILSWSRKGTGTTIRPLLA